MNKIKVSETQRRSVFLRARQRCEYCRSSTRYSSASFCVDPIFPRVLGGPNHLDNLALACYGCNAAKADRISALDPETETEVAIYHPRRDRWSDHFA